MANHTPPLKRRSFLKLGIGAAVALTVVGGAVALLKPGLVDGKLSRASRLLMTRVAQAMLDGTLPKETAAQQRALDGVLERLEQFLGRNHERVQAEVSQLLGLLATAAGRRGLVGLSASWEEATVADTTAALNSMRETGLSLRIQAYQGLHDLVCVAYFTGQESWATLGYPGPVALA